MMTQTEVENPMVVDWWWDEQEYRVPSRARLERERQAYEEAEREGRVYGGSKDSHHTGAGQDIQQL